MNQNTILVSLNFPRSILNNELLQNLGGIQSEVLQAGVVVVLQGDKDGLVPILTPPAAAGCSRSVGKCGNATRVDRASRDGSYDAADFLGRQDGGRDGRDGRL